jgi:hypothetical protein
MNEAARRLVLLARGLGLLSIFAGLFSARFGAPLLVAYVTTLRSRQSPSKIARQLPGLSTTPCVEPLSTGDAAIGEHGLL